MRITAPCIAAAFSAALAACCLAAGHGHAPAVRPVLPAVQSCPALQSAGQALTVLRRRTLAAARRTAQALLLCLAAAAAALILPAGAELWVEPQALPAGCTPPPRRLRLPGRGHAARPGRSTPPGRSAAPARAGPDLPAEHKPGRRMPRLHLVPFSAFSLFPSPLPGLPDGDMSRNTAEAFAACTGRLSPPLPPAAGRDQVRRRPSLDRPPTAGDIDPPAFARLDPAAPRQPAHRIFRPAGPASRRPRAETLPFPTRRRRRAARPPRPCRA